MTSLYVYVNASTNAWVNAPVWLTCLPWSSSRSSNLSLLPLNPPPNQADTTQMLHSPPPTRRVSLPVPRLILGTKKKCYAASVVWFRPPPRRLNYVVLPQNYDVIERDGKKKAPSSSCSLISAITAFASRTLHKMMKRKRNAFELAEPLQDVGKIAKSQNWLSIFIFSSQRFNLPSRVYPCNLQWHLLMFSRPQYV